MLPELFTSNLAMALLLKITWVSILIAVIMIPRIRDRFTRFVGEGKNLIVIAVSISILLMAGVAWGNGDGYCPPSWNCSYDIPQAKNYMVIYTEAPPYPTRARNVGITGMVEFENLEDAKAHIKWGKKDTGWIGDDGKRHKWVYFGVYKLIRGNP